MLVNILLFIRLMENTFYGVISLTYTTGVEKNLDFISEKITLEHVRLTSHSRMKCSSCCSSMLLIFNCW